jgi:integrase
VLVDNSGQRMDRHTAGRVLARLGRRAGLGTVRPHTLRATAITCALDAGVSLRDVQDMARHSDPRTTRRYDRARGSLDRHASYAIAGYLAAAS